MDEKAVRRMALPLRFDDFAVRQRDLEHLAEVLRGVARRMSGDGHFHARLEYGWRNPKPNELVRNLTLEPPLHHFSAVVLLLDEDPRVRVLPTHFGDHTLHGNRLVDVVG